MQFDRQVQLTCFDKDAFDLSRGKRQVLTERIHRINQTFGGQGREHLVADVGNVIVGTVLVFRRQGVRGKAGAAYAQR
ncbi:hypothetical protein D9M71_658340 [compost metagenome]